MYIFQVIKTSLQLLNKQQRIKLFFLLLFFLISALIQIVGVASIGPFIAIISSPEIIKSNPILSYSYDNFGFTDNTSFIIALASISLFMIALSNGVAILTLWLQMRFTILVGGELQARLFKNFIGRPYIYHKSENYTVPTFMISQETPRFIYMVLLPLMLLFSNIFVASVILVGLLILNPYIAIQSAVLIVGTYAATYFFLKISLSKHGETVNQHGKKVQLLLSESFIGIKDILLNSLQGRYGRLFGESNTQGLKSAAFIALSGDIPRFVIETISFAAILILAIIFLLQSESTATIVSMLSIYALAGYKLLPAMQQIYKSASSLSAHGEVPFRLRLELSKASHINTNENIVPLESINNITLHSIKYIYPNVTTAALDSINLSFNAGEINTIAGHSGSGKSTLIDIILALLNPSSGHITIDGKELTSELKTRYQKSIGYVPQNIFVLDDSVAANIAFGVPKECIDRNKVIRALTLANAIGFVNTLPNGIDSSLGQDGKLLSGGQRQRIGIARSLYRDNKVLILDEPTSALDIESEFEFIQTLTKIKKSILIIVISHRAAAIKCSDTITLLDNGSVVASGTFETLIETNLNFKEMMEKSSI